jgi:hypothetical protein
MADTATAQEPANLQLGPSLSDVARSVTTEQQDWGGAFRDWRAASEKQSTALEKSAAERRPKLDAIKAEIPDLAKQGKEKLAALEAAKPAMPPPPSRKLTDFLAPVNGESPEASISKFIQAAGLFATGISGLVKGDARAGLASLTGAMQGWVAGDKERADRAWADWDSQTQSALKKYELQRKATEDWFAHAPFSLEMGLKGIEIQALIDGDEQLALAARTRDHEAVLKLIGERDKNAAAMADAHARLVDAKQKHAEDLAEKQAAREAADARAREFEEGRREDRREALEQRATLAREKFAAKREEAGAEQQFTPESLDFIAQQYYITGNLPPMGMGKASTEARTKILNKAAEIARGAGTSAADQVARSQFSRASQNELSQLMSQRGKVMAFASTADQNLDRAVELSAKVDRTGVPVFNRWLLAGRQQIAGDPDVTNFHIFNDRAVTEIARLTSSATGGGTSTDSARREASELLKTAYTAEQYKQAVQSLKDEVEFRRKGYEGQIKATQEQVKKLSVQPMPEAPKLRVKRKSDGATGTLDAKDMSDLYELVK